MSQFQAKAILIGNSGVGIWTQNLFSSLVFEAKKVN